MVRHRVAVVIPALNEEKTIKDVVDTVKHITCPVVVDDGSSDATGAVAKAAGAEVVRHQVNRGYDQALNTGFARAVEIGSQYIVTMDADGQHDPRLLEQFVSRLEQGADLVVGVRDKHQRISEWVFAVVGRFAWGIRDPLCGMKAYRRELYLELGHFDCYGSIGTELAIYAARSNKNIVQIPLMTRERTDKPRFGSLCGANRKILGALLKAFKSRCKGADCLR